MNNINLFSDHCCGCGLCAAVCNQKAISMQVNADGFVTPCVDAGKCTDCGLCVKKCAYNKESHLVSEAGKYYLVQHKDALIRARSRSGGAFTAVSDGVLQRGGSVYGCKMITAFEAKHTRAISRTERDAFLGSKYLQSDITECYSLIKNDLENGKWVLFSGTPCQVEAVKSFCRHMDTGKLVLADIVCYGVPGRYVWGDYLKVLKSYYRKSIKKIDFRNKALFGWARHVESIDFENGEHYDGEIYARLFASKLILRDACFSCPYKSTSRVGDITLADAWGIDDTYQSFHDNQGTSLVLINSEKGKNLFEQISGSVNRIELKTLDGFLQPCLKENWSRPGEYEAFWEDFHRMNLEDLLCRYISTSVKDTVIKQKRSRVCAIKQKIKRILRNGKG